MQALAPLLQLAPCPFWRLEAAIAPGPRLPPKEMLPEDNADGVVASDPHKVDEEGQLDPNPSITEQQVFCQLVRLAAFKGMPVTPLPLMSRMRGTCKHSCLLFLNSRVTFRSNLYVFHIMVTPWSYLQLLWSRCRALSVLETAV